MVKAIVTPPPLFAPFGFASSTLSPTTRSSSLVKHDLVLGWGRGVKLLVFESNFTLSLFFTPLMISLFLFLVQFDQYLRQELNANEDASFCICTDGQLHIRQCLHPQATSKGVELPDYFYQFFDIRKEFRRKYPEAPIIIDVKDMAQCILSQNLNTSDLNSSLLGSLTS